MQPQDQTLFKIINETIDKGLLNNQERSTLTLPATLDDNVLSAAMSRLIGIKDFQKENIWSILRYYQYSLFTLALYYKKQCMQELIDKARAREHFCKFRIRIIWYSDNNCDPKYGRFDRLEWYTLSKFKDKSGNLKEYRTDLPRELTKNFEYPRSAFKSAKAWELEIIRRYERIFGNIRQQRRFIFEIERLLKSMERRLDHLQQKPAAPKTLTLEELNLGDAIFE